LGSLAVISGEHSIAKKARYLAIPLTAQPVTKYLPRLGGAVQQPLGRAAQSRNNLVSAQPITRPRTLIGQARRKVLSAAATSLAQSTSRGARLCRRKAPSSPLPISRPSTAAAVAHHAGTSSPTAASANGRRTPGSYLSAPNKTAAQVGEQAGWLRARGIESKERLGRHRFLRRR
jgi:hypothetical protein